jgi:excisionase family DNA binding protein
MSGTESGEQERLMTPGEVAALFRVHVSTVARWATEGRLGAIVTPGGHRRYRRSDVEALLARGSGSGAEG